MLIGQHAQSRCAGRFVSFRDGDGIEILADDTFGRTGFFHLGDQPYLRISLHGFEEVSWSRSLGRIGLKLTQGTKQLGLLDLLAFFFDDLQKDRTHAGTKSESNTRTCFQFGFCSSMNFRCLGSVW